MDREAWAFAHGFGLGIILLLAFAAGMAGLYRVPHVLSSSGIGARMPRLLSGTWIAATAAWLAVTTGTWMIYPWYRASDPASPRSLLLADPTTAQWHTLGMEWKEHVAWIAPIIATAVAFVVLYYGAQLAREHVMRRSVTWLFAIAFAAVLVAGGIGTILDYLAPVG